MMKISLNSRLNKVYLPGFLSIMLIISVSYASAQTNKYNDCQQAFVICEMGTYHFDKMGGSGIPDRLPTIRCDVKSEFKETNSVWLKWKTTSSGELSFIIDPSNEMDDIDFILFKSVHGDCGQIEEVRCMLSGSNIGSSDGQSELCKGITGLSLRSSDEYENQGCNESDDNFLKYIDCNPGEDYYLLVNNFDSDMGFSVSFDGSVLFNPQGSACDKSTKNDFLLYPNPTTSILNIELSDLSLKGSRIEILDLKGRLLIETVFERNSSLNKESIDISNLSQGLYLVRLKNESHSVVKHFVKM